MWISGGKDCKSLIHLTIASDGVANNQIERSIFRLSGIPEAIALFFRSKWLYSHNLLRTDWMFSSGCGEFCGNGGRRCVGVI
jgi:hypothetical protein